MSNVVPITPDADLRIDALVEAIDSIIVERAVGKLPVATVIGALDIVRLRLFMSLDGYDDVLE